MKKTYALIGLSALVAACNQTTGTSTSRQANPIDDYQVGESISDVMRNGQQAPEMIVLPRGTFLMGSPPDEEGREPDEGPQKTIHINYQLAVSKYEVTNKDWSYCVEAGVCRPPLVREFALTRKPSLRSVSENEKHPVIGISWHDAQQYVSWLSLETGQPYRLLSESEWEYAARGGTIGRYSNDLGYKNLCEISNHKDRELDWAGNNPLCSDGYRLSTAPVGSYQPNPFGLYDMHGNVYEWVADCYRDDLRKTPTNGAPVKDGCPFDQKIMRGGSYYYSAKYSRSASRVIRYEPGSRFSFLGLRIARDLP